MGLLGSPESSSGILNAVKGSLGLFADTNKAFGLNENSNIQPIDEYESTFTEVEILELIAQWKRDYNVYYYEIDKKQKLNFDYWIGKQRNSDDNSRYDSNQVVDNLLFEAIETFLPIATRANPDPLVTADPGDIGQKLAYDVKAALVDIADRQVLRRKLAKVTRQWLINRIGVIKVCWDVKVKAIQIDVINSKRFIFDKDGYINEKGEFTGDYIGEKKKCKADILIQMFPKKVDVIKAACQGKLGTKLEYIEWWYCAKDVFYTLNDHVLGKYKNPNWNYDGTTKDIDPETGTETETEIQGTNHLKEMSYPYRFLSIFSTGEQPHDNTGLIDQNIPLQDNINKRGRQIDHNVDGMNNGMVVSGSAFTEEQATQAAAALRRGVAIRVPDGDVQKAVLFPERPGLPSDVFRSRDDSRSELKNIFGTAGSNAQSIASQDTVRGKIMVQQMDSSRIGGGVTEFLEQLADAIYNLCVQMMFVYYDEEQYVNAAGATAGTELIVLKNDRFPLIKTLNITVKEGSLIPKDPLTQRNEAIDLWSANAIDPRTFYKRLDFPDPDEATNQLILWQMLQKGQISPQEYLPSFAPAGQPAQQSLPTSQPGTGGPAVSPPPTTPQPGQQPPASGTNDAAALQNQQLLASQPIH